MNIEFQTIGDKLQIKSIIYIAISKQIIHI